MVEGGADSAHGEDGGTWGWDMAERKKKQENKRRTEKGANKDISAGLCLLETRARPMWH
jgi:hypothetical protein